MLAVKTYNNDLNIFRRPVRLMGNLFEISVVGNDPIWADNCIDSAIEEISRVEKLLSTFSDDSQINEINRNAGIKPIKVNAEIFRLVERSLKISELTFGTFDITYNAVDTNTEAAKIELESVKFTNYKNVQ